MEELKELKGYIRDGKYHDALMLVDELEEMSKDDKINKIERYLIILLSHLIKQMWKKGPLNLGMQQLLNLPIKL